MSVKDHLQKLGKICVTCQVNQSVDDANNGNLEGCSFVIVLVDNDNDSEDVDKESPGEGGVVVGKSFHHLPPRPRTCRRCWCFRCCCALGSRD